MSRSPGADKPDLIVLLEDDAALRAALRFDLVTAGFRVTTFASAEALLAQDLETCACVVTDLHLPAMSGLEAIEDLRTRRCATPTILMTTQPTQAVRARAKAAGALVVEKPILGDRLVKAIRTLLAG
jgi:FixJ family two-component response regulator